MQTRVMIPGDDGIAPQMDPPWEGLARAHRLLRRAAAVLARASAHEAPPPFSPVRCLLLAHLESATAFGLTPGRLARLLEMSPSSLAHHLDVLEGAELIMRSPRGLHDRRKVSVRLTDRGRGALWGLRCALERKGAERSLEWGGG